MVSSPNINFGENWLVVEVHDSLECSGLDNDQELFDCLTVGN